MLPMASEQIMFGKIFQEQKWKVWSFYWLLLSGLEFWKLAITFYIFRETSLFLSDILSDIEKKTLEVEKSESQAYKGEEETNYELLPLVPKSEAQKQYLPTFSENEYEVTLTNWLLESSLISQIHDFKMKIEDNLWFILYRTNT